MPHGDGWHGRPATSRVPPGRVQATERRRAQRRAIGGAPGEARGDSALHRRRGQATLPRENPRRLYSLARRGGDDQASRLAGPLWREGTCPPGPAETTTRGTLSVRKGWKRVVSHCGTRTPPTRTRSPGDSGERAPVPGRLPLSPSAFAAETTRGLEGQGPRCQVRRLSGAQRARGAGPSWLDEEHGWLLRGRHEGAGQGASGMRGGLQDPPRGPRVTSNADGRGTAEGEFSHDSGDSCATVRLQRKLTGLLASPASPRQEVR